MDSLWAWEGLVTPWLHCSVYGIRLAISVAETQMSVSVGRLSGTINVWKEKFSSLIIKGSKSSCWHFWVCDEEDICIIQYFYSGI